MPVDKTTRDSRVVLALRFTRVCVCAVAVCWVLRYVAARATSAATVREGAFIHPSCGAATCVSGCMLRGLSCVVSEQARAEAMSVGYGVVQLSDVTKAEAVLMEAAGELRETNPYVPDPTRRRRWDVDHTLMLRARVVCVRVCMVPASPCLQGHASHWPPERRVLWVDPVAWRPPLRDGRRHQRQHVQAQGATRHDGHVRRGSRA